MRCKYCNKPGHYTKLGHWICITNDCIKCNEILTDDEIYDGQKMPKKRVKKDETK